MKKNNALYGVRFFMTMGVVYGHMHFGYTFRMLPVAFFLVVSGVLHGISRKESYTGREALSYYKGKIAKNYPLYLGVSVAAFFLMYLTYHIWFVFPTDIALHLLMVKTWIPYHINRCFWYGGAIWYMSLQMFCYYVLPLLANVTYKRVPKKSSVNLVLMAVVLAIYAVIIFLVPVQEVEQLSLSYWFLYLSPLRVLEFIAGFFFGRAMKYSAKLPALSKMAWTILEVVCWGGAIAIIYALPLFNKWELGFLGAILSIVLIYLSFYSDGYISELLSKPFFKTLGLAGSWVFMVHQPVYDALLLFGFSVEIKAGELAMNLVRLLVVPFVMFAICILVMRFMEARKKRVTV